MTSMRDLTETVRGQQEELELQASAVEMQRVTMRAPAALHCMGEESVTDARAAELRNDRGRQARPTKRSKRPRSPKL